MAHRRRGVGVGRSGAGANRNLQRKADEMHALSLQSAVETIEKLQVSLQDFAKKHQSDIQNDPLFRQQFLRMCGPLGVDPLQSRKSFWSQAFGADVGDYYYELAVKVAEVCFATRSQNGGIMAVQEALSILNRNKSQRQSSINNKNNNSRKGRDKLQLYNEGDIQIAVKKLHTLGGGFRIVKVGKSDMIVSVPTELDQDHMEVLNLASTESVAGGQGCVTVDDVTQQLHWSRDRAGRALSLLLQEGMAWQDDFHGVLYYWFPSVWKENLSILRG
ncbi:EAP30/Vps36 family protein [Nitzschia inconspicua]|uniref:EAP30/Vps36 family protein n=1 Tax=Nitzschia inconspicua TaxID=303405 RepID=A0A9K3PRH0_9STRA|nr:EAP30/Vps36 family protein [Nitzschia inconspicua]